MTNPTHETDPLKPGELVRLKGSKVTRRVDGYIAGYGQYLLTSNIDTGKGGGQFARRDRIERVSA